MSPPIFTRFIHKFVGMNHRTKVSSGTIWEDQVGYSRAIRVGNVIEIAGTTAMDGIQIQCPGDVFGQTTFILQKMTKAMESLGGQLQDVVRTRIYLADIKLWEEAGRAHGAFFREIKPVSTMLAVQALIHPDLLVEIEMTAIIPQEHV
jgi:enamine deaminase RidA (YjgF/YER057c/UK114 family)